MQSQSFWREPCKAAPIHMSSTHVHHRQAMCHTCWPAMHCVYIRAFSEVGFQPAYPASLWKGKVQEAPAAASDLPRTRTLLCGALNHLLIHSQTLPPPDLQHALCQAKTGPG